MGAPGTARFTRAEIEAIIDNAATIEPNDLEMASEFFEQHVIRILDGSRFDLPENAIGYHVDDAFIVKRLAVDAGFNDTCPLINGTLSARNGVVLKRGHADLKCSSPGCSCSVCPFGLAACFTALDDLGSPVIPLYSESIDVAQDISRFRQTWGARLVNSDHALNLILSRYENDFSGLLVVEDDSYLDEFLTDLERILVRMDKIDKDGMRRQHISALLMSVNAADATFHGTQDENLAPRQLYVCDRLSDFFQRDPQADFAARYLIERFGHIVDHRYLILVGTRGELTKFIGLSPTLELLLGEHRLELPGMSAEDIYPIYLERLDEGLRTAVDESFRERFVRYVEFNSDALPFRGAELAEYLAKTANASGTLALPRSRYQSSSLDEMLDSIVGLDAVKKTVRELEAYAIFSKRMQGRGRAMPTASMHMAFVGNPGTGKTTVARIIATMLYKIGIIPQNKCLEVTSKDLIAKYVGHTDKQVFDVVQKARGGVLFIDEAYALAPDPHSAGGFAREALAELVKCMEDYRDDLVVILAGYEREMKDFIDTNPGLASRIGYTFRFEDFTTEQLVEIFMRELKRSGLSAKDDIAPDLAGLFDYFRGFKNFGNGRFVREVLQRALINHANRTAASLGAAQDDDIAIERADIPSRRAMLDTLDMRENTAVEMLEPLVGLADVKQKIYEMERVVTFREQARRAGLSLPDMNLHMVLTGNPGTGKTTVARIIGRVLFNIGAVPTDRFIEVEAKDLTSHFVGGTADETTKHIEAALGGILFIDEAYALLDNSSGLEALATLVKAMEDHKGELVVMFAGYEREMRRFLDANPGLASRIGYTFRFEDYKPEELLEVFDRKMAKAGFTVSEEARAKAGDLMRYFNHVDNFGNGRFVDRVIQEVITLRANAREENLIASAKAAQLEKDTAGDAKANEDNAFNRAIMLAGGAASTAGAALPRNGSSDAGNHSVNGTAENQEAGAPAADVGNVINEPTGAGASRTTAASGGSIVSMLATPQIKVETKSASSGGEIDLLRIITADHVPTIEAMCKLTAADILEPSDLNDADALRRVACHEVGHALVSLATRGRCDIVTITIEQEGTGTLGYVQHERRATALPTPQDIENEVAVLMGGMAAERMVFGAFSAGNSSDLKQATRQARAYAATYGMSDAGFVQFPYAGTTACKTEDLPPAVLDAMNALLDEGLASASAILEEHRAVFDTMVEKLLGAGTLKGADMEALWKEGAAR